MKTQPYTEHHQSNYLSPHTLVLNPNQQNTPIMANVEHNKHKKLIKSKGKKLKGTNFGFNNQYAFERNSLSHHEAKTTNVPTYSSHG